MTTPLVSISCITYNHAPYVRKCLDAFMMQKTNFAFEVVIHDDASTDGTQEIIKEYQERYPDVFFPLIQKENQYSKGVRSMMAKFNFPRCRGKYIALCEGDDYWTDPEKLQKQVDFLENNPEFVLTSHDALIINSQGELISKSRLPADRKRDCSALELKKCFYVLTQSMCFRNLPIFKQMPEEAFTSKVGDVFLISILGQFGSCKYISEIKPTAYRVHENGIWAMKPEDERSTMLRSAFFQLCKYYGRTNDRRMELYHAQMVLKTTKDLLNRQLDKSKGFIDSVKAYFGYVSRHLIFKKPVITIKLFYIGIFKK